MESRAKNRPKQRSTWPKPWVYLLTYGLAAVGISAALLLTGRGPELLYLLVPFTLLAGFYYRRGVYAAMLLILLALALLVALAADGDISQSLVKVAAALIGVGTMTEITHQMASAQSSAEKALRSSQHRLAAILKSVQSGILTIDATDGRVLDANPAALQMVGLSAEELLGTSFYERVHPEDRNGVLAIFTHPDAPDCGEVVYRFRHADGRYLWVETAAKQIHDESGKPIACVLGSRDITGRRLSDQVLRDSEAKYRTLFNTISDPIFLCDRDSGRILDCNQSAIDRYGYSRDELMGMTLGRLCLPSADDERTRRAGTSHNETHLTRAGQRIEVEVHSADLEYEGKHATLVVARDVTERNRSERVQAALYQIAQAAITADNLDELYRQVHDILGKLIPTENYFIALYDSEANLISFPYFIDQFDTQPAPRRPTKGLTEYVIQTGQPLFASPEVFADLEEKGLVETHGTPSLDWLGVPLMVGNRTIGVMVVQTYSEGVRFGPADLDILTFVSSQVAMAIERKRAEMALRQSQASLERHSNRLSRILDTSSALRINLSLDELLAEIVRSTSTSLGFGTVVLNLLDEESGLVRIRTHYGLDEAGRCALEGAAYTQEDLNRLFQERFRVGDCYFIPEGAVNWDSELSGPTYTPPLEPPFDTADNSFWKPNDMLVTPIVLHEGQVAGFISVDKPLDGRRPDREKLQALAIFTNQAAAAIENARLYERAQNELAERKRVEERLWILSTHDALTGLYNRAYFESEMARLKPEAHNPISVVMVDVDDLKITNDRFGHAAGDELLRRTARVLKNAFRAEDVIARIGGDEFAVLLPGADEATALESVQRVLDMLEAHNARNPGIPLFVSVGASTADQRTSLEEALKLADKRMYSAKQSRRRERRRRRA